MIKKSRKGFTIVELIIVIAVVAVLAAILIPTFIHLSNKASEASDKSLVTNLNKALAMREQEPGDTKNNIMHDAVLDLHEEGYELPQLLARTDEGIVWNQKTNRFLLANEAVENENIKFVDYWKIENDMPSEQKFSIYAGHKWNKEVKTITGLTVGFDVGYYSDFDLINYDRTDDSLPNYSVPQTVGLRSDGGNIVINAPLDTVNHYDYIDTLDINAIDGSHSYHEYGRVRVRANVKNGHVVVEPNGYVNELDIPANATNVSVDIQPEGVVETAVNDNSSATVVVSQGAEVGQYVGETTNVSGAGSQEVIANAVTKTFVKNESELKAAVSNHKKYVALTESFSAGAFDSGDNSNVSVSVTSDLILDGQGNTLTVTKGRGIWIDADNVTLTVKNLKIVGKSGTTQRAVQVNGGIKGAVLKIENCEMLQNFSYYTVNICDNVGVDLIITNSKIKGYGAVNLWSAKYTVYIANSELTGYNDKNYGSSNSFATVILEGDTTEQTTLHSSKIDVKIVNTTINAVTTGQGNHEWCILFNLGSTSNTVECDGCTFNYKDDEKTHLYRDDGEGNKLIIDGVQANQ